MTEEFDVKWISGFWRRVGALFIDGLILGLVGFTLSLMLEKYFVEIGIWGRLIGFFIALLYFGVMNSRLTKGQTIGKKLLKLRVVNIKNETISLPTSFARYCILGIPYFLNGTQFSNEIILSFWIYPISFIIFGGLFSIIYLYIFNRITRQSLHDLIVGTYVVNAHVETQEVSDIWKPHLVIAVFIFLLATAAPAITTKLIEKEPFNDLLAAQTALLNNPSVNHATASFGATWTSSEESESSSSTFVRADVFLKENIVDDKELGLQLAELVVSNYPDSKSKDVIHISLIYGYDIGITSKWYSFSHSFDLSQFEGLNK